MMFPSNSFRRRSGYEDLDKSNQSSKGSLSDLIRLRSYVKIEDQTKQKEIVAPKQQHKSHLFSISDTALNIPPHANSVQAISQTLAPSFCPLSHQQEKTVLNTPHHTQSMLGLSDGVSIGSIVLLPSQITSTSRAAQGCIGDTQSCYGCGSNYDDLGHRHHRVNQLVDDTNLDAAEKWKFLPKQNIRLLVYILFYCVYLVIGSVCFQIVETPVEKESRIALRLLRTNFLQKYPQIFEEDLEEFLKAVVMANDRGISPLRNASNEMNWSFGQAIFFSSTVITTIGYGRVTPLSQTGKIFCIIYAAMGIPLTLVLLSAMVERLLLPASWLLGTLNSKLGHLYQPFNIRLLHLSVIAAIVIVLFFAIPTTIFACIEPSWGALDAFYYCFISLTTIGLGDYIPGEGVSIDNLSMYKIFISAYLVCGLIAMMFLLTIFYDIPQLNLGQLFTESGNGGETEKLRLSSNNTTCYSGPSGLYMPQRNEDTKRAIVRIRPHDNESPSPDEAPSSLNCVMGGP